jgi:hypothetical protein
MVMFIMMVTILLMTSTICRCSACLCMLYSIGANIIPGLIKMAKIMKIRINC